MQNTIATRYLWQYIWLNPQTSQRLLQETKVRCPLDTIGRFSGHNTDCLTVDHSRYHSPCILYISIEEMSRRIVCSQCTRLQLTSLPNYPCFSTRSQKSVHLRHLISFTYSCPPVDYASNICNLTIYIKYWNWSN